MDDPFVVHSYFIIGFVCEACHRETTSPHEECTIAWYIDQARQAKAQEWHIPPFTEEDPWGRSVWCSDCAAKLGLRHSNTPNHT